jgi:hypothetical protein
MNYFFNLFYKDFNSYIDIPLFDNRGLQKTGNKIWSARMKRGEWEYEEIAVSDKQLKRISGTEETRDCIYFIATDSEILCNKKTSLLNLSVFTDTMPDYRCSLNIENKFGGFSSYQAEYPYRMTKSKGDCYSNAGLLTHEEAKKILLFVRNIDSAPVQQEALATIYSNRTKKIIGQKLMYTNSLNVYDLTEMSFELKYCEIFIKGMVGIPIYLLEYEGGALSLEHTHPPQDMLGGFNKYAMISKMKAKLHDDIFANSSKI